MRNGFVSDEQYQHSLAVFKELLDADVYESGNKKNYRKVRIGFRYLFGL
ncbi:hypothetical protein [Citrobacter portucalensis]|nr:hypothetical protein [Citrobacter portucalensis]